MLAVEQIQQFYLYKKRTDSRFSVPTVVDLFIDNDDNDDDDLCRSQHASPELLHRPRSRYDLIRMMDQRRRKIRKALNKNRFLAEELNLAVEQLATDRANLMLERHLLAVTRERMRIQKEKWSSSSSLRGLIRSKFKGIPPESLSVESLLDVDKNNNSKLSSSSTSDVDPGRNFQASIMLEDRLRKHFPKLRERCRNLADVDEATKLQEDIKLQEEILNYLYLKVEAIIFKKAFKKPTNTKPVPTTTALVPLSSSSTLSTPKPDDKRRKRKQLLPSTASSRLQAQSSEDARSSGRGSMENLFRDVIGQLGTDSRSASRSTSSTTGVGTFQQVMIQIVDS